MACFVRFAPQHTIYTHWFRLNVYAFHMTMEYQRHIVYDIEHRMRTTRKTHKMRTSYRSYEFKWEPRHAYYPLYTLPLDKRNTFFFGWNEKKKIHLFLPFLEFSFKKMYFWDAPNKRWQVTRESPKINHIQLDAMVHMCCICLIIYCCVLCVHSQWIWTLFKTWTMDLNEQQAYSSQQFDDSSLVESRSCMFNCRLNCRYNHSFAFVCH